MMQGEQEFQPNPIRDLKVPELVFQQHKALCGYQHYDILCAAWPLPQVVNSWGCIQVGHPLVNQCRMDWGGTG